MKRAAWPHIQSWARPLQSPLGLYPPIPPSSPIVGGTHTREPGHEGVSLQQLSGTDTNVSEAVPQGSPLPLSCSSHPYCTLSIQLSWSTALEQVRSSLEGHLPLQVPPQGPIHPLSEHPADRRRGGGLPPPGSAGEAEEWRSQEERPLLPHLKGRCPEWDGL